MMGRWVLATNKIEYFFSMPGGKELRFEVDTERAANTEDKATQSKGEAFAPAWADLDFNKCTNCPLSASEEPLCPVAIDLHEILDQFREIISHEQMMVRVRSPRRDYQRTVDAQTALTSLIGLVMATSACPILGKLRPMARLHLPFASVQETAFRTVAVQLLRKFFQAKDGSTPDWELEELHELYKELETVNGCFFKRIEAAAEKDANINAIANLFSLSTLITMSLDRDLDSLRPLLE
jgi:hypothetical protein